VHLVDKNGNRRLEDFEEVANNWDDYKNLIFRESFDVPQIQSKKLWPYISFN
jgi:hypothetical protein